MKLNYKNGKKRPRLYTKIDPILDWWRRGGLNSTTLENPILLVFSLLDQLANLGDTAKQLRQVFGNYNPKSKNLLSNILIIEERVK